jgi:hypothetical protein
MTSGFIKTFVSSFLLFAVVGSAYAAPAVPYGPDGPANHVYPGPNGWAVAVKCKDSGTDDDCEVSALENGRSTLSIFKGSVLPGVHWYSDIAMMSFPCGSGCRNDLFFSPPNKIDGHPLVAENAIDVRRRLVVSVESNPLKVYRLFDGSTPVATLHLNTAFTQPDVEQLRFERTRLLVWYRDDAGTMRRASVAIPSEYAPILVHAQALEHGMTFPAARKKLLHHGWEPVITNKLNSDEIDYKLIGIEKILRRNGFDELESCAVDRSLCIFNYRKNGKCLRLITKGEDPSRLTILSWSSECPH